MINQQLAKNPLFLTAQNDVRSICNNLLNPLGISYFNYLRAYNNGSCYLLTTHGDLIQYVFQHNIPVAAPVDEKYVKKNFNYFILPTGAYNKLLHHAKINLNLGNFIDLVDRHDDYIELFCFGSTPENSEIVNFYLGNLDFLGKFKFYFKDKAHDLLKQGENNKVVLPKEMYPPYQGLLNNPLSSHEAGLPKILKPKNYYLEGNLGNLKITQRQYECLSQLAHGYTAKEIANKRGISFRTVENNIANLKSVLGCHRKSELINIFLKNFR